MRIGISATRVTTRGASLDELVAHAVAAEADGFSTYWVTQGPAPDALTAIAVMGRETSRIEFATGVVPTWTRHPLMLATQALTVQEATGNRFVLGIGVAHKISMEERFEIPFVTPAKHMDEYLSVLLPTLTDHKVDFHGDIWSGHWEVPGFRDAAAPQVMLAAMGPRMLELAGARTAGTILWLSGPKVIREKIKPALDAAAAAAGNPTPRIGAAMPVVVTSQPDEARALIDKAMWRYATLPSYKAVLDAVGAKTISDVSLIGTDDEVRAGVQAFAEAGATDFTAIEFVSTPAEAQATRELLADIQAKALAGQG